MALDPTHQPASLTPAFGSLQVTTRDGLPTEYFLNIIQEYQRFINGMNRVIPCDATGTNGLVLTPNEVSPLLKKYIDYEIFVFRAPATSTSGMTLTVVPIKGTLPVLNLYKDGGSTPAGSGDVVAGRLYLAVYASYLDSGAGGFVLK
jgi:hypothetical protein